MAALEALAPLDVIIGQLEIPQAVTAVTLGARGAALLREDGRVTRIAAEPVRALDTTGAGDAFIGAFAFGLARRLPAEAAVRLGVRCATDSVLRPGTQASFPRGAALEPLLAGLA